MITRRNVRLAAVLGVCLLSLALSVSAFAANFTSGASPAQKFGTHEIVLQGRSSVPNPFDTVGTVRFTPPSGPANAVTVDAFYDGGDTWRARVYVTETGAWTWTSTSTTDPGLDSKSGTFVSVESTLRGALRKHKANPHAWMTDDGQWFPNISDTAYRLFHAQDAPLWREFVRDASAKGVDCLRVASLGGWGGTANVPVDDNDTWMWNDPWAGGAAPLTEPVDGRQRKRQGKQDDEHRRIAEHPAVMDRIVAREPGPVAPGSAARPRRRRGHGRQPRVARAGGRPGSGR